MGALATKLLAQLQALATPLAGPLGIAIVTIGIAGSAIAVLKFGRHVSILWTAFFAGMIVLGAGIIAGGLG